MVIAVIAILAALLLPALGRARLKALDVACLSNERQIDLKYRMAVDDSGGRLDQFADARVLNMNTEQHQIWDWWTNEIGRAQLCWICPSAPRPEKRRDNFVGLDGPDESSGTYNSAWSWPVVFGGDIRSGSYGQNGWVFGWSTLYLLDPLFTQ